MEEKQRKHIESRLPKTTMDLKKHVLPERWDAFLLEYEEDNPIVEVHTIEDAPMLNAIFFKGAAKILYCDRKKQMITYSNGLPGSVTSRKMAAHFIRLALANESELTFEICRKLTASMTLGEIQDIFAPYE